MPPSADPPFRSSSLPECDFGVISMGDRDPSPTSCIVSIFEIGEQPGPHYFSMKLIEGGSLAEHLPRLSADHQAAVRFMATVARAVHHAHQHGVLHRDLKPANILLDAQGEPFVTDFGLARRIEAQDGLTQTGAVVGTPNYMAPEQASGKKGLTTAVDVYALGAILYELLTGRPPFQAETPLDTLRQVLETDPKPPRALNPQVDRDLELVCLKCLAKDPQQRYASADALAADLRHWLASEPLGVRPPGPASLLRMWMRQNFGAAGWTVVIGLVAGIMFGVRAWVLSINDFQGLAEAAYGRFPSLDPPWLALTWRIPLFWRWVLRLMTGVVVVSMGLLTVVLVRPKNRSAVVAAGAITGLVATVAAFTVSVGWVGVLWTAVYPVDRDLRLLSAAAFGERAPDPDGQGQAAVEDAEPLDRLMDKYPDLRNAPAAERSRLLHRKLRADLLAGIPVGIWLSMLLMLGLCEGMSIGQTLVASLLLCRYKNVRTMIVPYIEFAVASMVALGGGGFLMLSAPFWWRIATLPVLGLVALVVMGILRQWPWQIRILLLGAWLGLFFFVFVGSGSLALANRRLPDLWSW